MSRPRFFVLVAGLLVMVLLAAVASLGIGAVSLSPADVMTALAAPRTAEPTTGLILWDLRLPRILLALLVGASLAGAGAAYQGLFRNPLADPFVIGAASGAGLGATVAIALGAGQAAVSGPLVQLAAFMGALVAVALVVTLGTLGAGASQAVTLLLAGAAVSTVLGSAVSLVMLLRDESIQVIFAWLLGGLATGGWPQLAATAPVVGIGLASIALLSRPLTALALGEESARGLGLSLPRLRLGAVVAATLTTAAAVAAAGIIGFVGLVAPHAARLLCGGRYERLLPVACLLGALLLVAADTFARTVAAPLEIPVGIVTALIGGPFFLYLLRSRRYRPEDG